MRRNIGKGSLSFLLVLSALLLGSRASAQAQSPVITFDAPGAGTTHGEGTRAAAINSGSAAVGRSDICDHDRWSTIALRAHHGTLRAFDARGATPYNGSRDGGDNPSRTIAGTSVADSNHGHGDQRAPDGTFTA